MAVGGTRKDIQVALGQLPACGNAGLEVLQLGLSGQIARQEQVGHLLVAKATGIVAAAHQVLDLVASKLELSPIGHDLAVHLVVAMDFRDGGEPHQNARAIGIAQAAFDVTLGVKLQWHLVHLLHALVEPV